MKIRIFQVFTGCLPLFSPVVFSAPSTSTTHTLIVAATPDTSPLSELDTPAAVSVVYGEDLRQAHQQINLSEGTFPVFRVYKWPTDKLCSGFTDVDSGLWRAFHFRCERVENLC